MKNLLSKIKKSVIAFFDCDYANYNCVGSSGRY